MTAVCIAGIIYVSAFARVYRQAQNIEQLNGEIASAAAQNEALVKNLAQLQSDHRIGPLAAKFQMTQDGASTFIDVIPAQSTGQREVASAL
jgi:cell division protein FtsL